MLTDAVNEPKLKTQRMVAFTNARTVCLAISAILLVVAILVPNDGYSQALSAGRKDLTWGPILFRVLLVIHAIAIAALGTIWGRTTERDTASIKQPVTNYSAWVILIGLSLVALALRLWSLNSAPWIDEVLTLVDFVRLPLGEIAITFPNQNQHMLYSVLARVAFEIFGESSWALRLPAVLFGIGSIWALFFFARRVAGVRPALLACGLMTFSYHHVWFSQNARGYTGLLMMTLLASWAWLEALKSDEFKWWALYVATVVAGMMTHTTMAFVVAAHGIVYAIFLFWPALSHDRDSGVSLERRAGFKPVVAWIVSVTVTLQLYALSLPQFLATGLHEESRNSEWTNPIWVMTETIQNLSIGFAGTAFVLLGAIFVVFGWLSIFQINRRAALLMVLPPILSGGLMLSLGHNLFPRFFFFAMGFGVLIVIQGALELPGLVFRSFSRIGSLANMAPRLGVGFAMFIILVSLITVPRNYAMPKQDFAGARDYVESHRSPDSTAVAVNLAGDMFAKYYAPDWVTTRDVARVDELQREGAVWMVYTMPFEIQAFNPELWKVIQNEYQTVREFRGTLNGGEVVVCVRRGQVKENE